MESKVMAKKKAKKASQPRAWLARNRLPGQADTLNCYTLSPIKQTTPITAVEFEAMATKRLEPGAPPRPVEVIIREPKRRKR